MTIRSALDALPASQRPTQLARYTQKTEDQKIQLIAIPVFQYDIPEPPQSLLSPLLHRAKDLIDTFRACVLRLGLQNRLIEARINDIIMNISWSEERKCAELGLLYFYLVNNKDFTFQNSLVDAFCEETTKNMDYLKAIHNVSFSQENSKIFSSGSVTNLMHGFVSLIFPDTYNFNEGGCFAVKEILGREVSLYLSEEQRHQIVTIVDHLIENINFRTKLMQPISVHKSMHFLIQRDMRLKVNEQPSLDSIRSDLLIALFSVMGQIEPNCFAVAPMQCYFRMQPELVLDTLITLLETGEIKVSRETISLLSLIDSMRTCDEMFVQDVQLPNVLFSNEMSVAYKILQQERRQFSGIERRVKYKDLIVEVFQSQAPLAKEVILSMKRNLLQLTFLSVIQFSSVNYYQKMPFLKGLKDALHQAVGEIEDFNAKTTASLWLLDEKNEEFSISENQITFDRYSQPFKLIDDQCDFKPFLEMRRLCYLKEKKLIPLDRISEIKAFLLDLFPEHEGLKSLDSEAFSISLAKFVSRYNADLNWNVYHESDAFLLPKTGSIPVYQIPNVGWMQQKAHGIVPPKKTEQSFFETLCEKLKSISSEKEFPLVSTRVSSHIFNLTPFKFKDFCDAEKCATLFEERVLIPAANLLRRRPSLNQKERVLAYTVGVGKQNDYFDAVLQKNIGWTLFREELIARLPLDKHVSLDFNINMVMVERKINALQHSISAILAQLGFEAMVNIHLPLGRIYYTPLELATLLHKAILRQAHCYVPLYKLEELACIRMGVPQVINLGSLNYVESRQEKVSQVHLILEYDFVKKTVDFKKRYKKMSSPLGITFDFTASSCLFLHNISHPESSSVL